MKEYVNSADILHYTRQYNFSNIFEDDFKIGRSLTTTPTKLFSKKHHTPNTTDHLIEINAIPLQKKLEEYNSKMLKLPIKGRASRPLFFHKKHEIQDNLKIIQKVTLLQLIKDISPYSKRKPELKKIHLKANSQNQQMIVQSTKDSKIPYIDNPSDLYIGMKKATTKSELKISDIKKKKKYQEQIKKEGKTHTRSRQTKQMIVEPIHCSFGIKSIFPLLNNNKSTSYYSFKRRRGRAQSKSFLSNCYKSPILTQILDIHDLLHNKPLVEEEAKEKSTICKSKSIEIAKIIDLKKVDLISVKISQKQKNGD